MAKVLREVHAAPPGSRRTLVTRAGLLRGQTSSIAMRAPHTLLRALRSAAAVAQQHALVLGRTEAAGVTGARFPVEGARHTRPVALALQARAAASLRVAAAAAQIA